MKFSVNKELIDIYRRHDKSEGYMLDFLLSSLDHKCCADAFSLFDTLNLKGEETEIEINESTVAEINSLFGTVDTTLIEKLLFTAVLFPEI